MIKKTHFLAAALVACLFGWGAAQAQTNTLGPKDVVLKGDARCTSCHEETDSPDVLKIGKSKHGTVADKRTPTCTSCHGESAAHLKDVEASAKNPAKPDVTFSKKSKVSAEARNAACQSCHNGDKQQHWSVSKHANRDVACTSCHQVHTTKDKVRDKRQQAEVCYTCHKEQRTQANLPSHHPIPEGKMTCSDCHNPHGSAGDKNLVRDTVNDTCYTCHMEKRGPFIHNHEPVSDNCSNCHNPHGTTTDAMLKLRPPMLCHQCHTPHGGAQLVLRGQANASTSGKSNVNYTQARGCMNCHTQVHGSNNPSGNPTPQFNFR